MLAAKSLCTPKNVPRNRSGSTSMDLEALIKQYQTRVETVVHREPSTPHDSCREHQIQGRTWKIIQPVTFTPYAATQPCSARCHFCSENLREIGPDVHASQLRPSSTYFLQLQEALNELQGLPISYSLSGLEMSDDRQWFLTLLNVLQSHARVSPVDKKVLYSNTSGLLAIEQDRELEQAIAKFEFSWIELSRHHFDQNLNQQLMRFRISSGAASNTAFEHCLSFLQKYTEAKLVCIVLSGGVDKLEQMQGYIHWARSLGVRKIIFRELSLLNDLYQNNSTYRYIGSARVSIANLARAYIEAKASLGLIFKQSTFGYYYKNLIVEHDDMQITFEASDYALLQQKHNTGRIYKLVFHNNGNLCADWNPSRHILFKATL